MYGYIDAVVRVRMRQTMQIQIQTLKHKEKKSEGRPTMLEKGNMFFSLWKVHILKTSYHITKINLIILQPCDSNLQKLDPRSTSDFLNDNVSEPRRENCDW